MKAITSLYSPAVDTKTLSGGTLAQNRGNSLSSADLLSVLNPTPVKPKITVLKNSLLLELQKLTKSLRAQVRNSVALLKFLHARKADNSVLAGATATEQLSWQSSFGESLTFRFSTNPEAFRLFTDTLLRKSYFLHHHAEVNPEHQLLKVRVAVSRLPELEQELSIVFEK